MLIKTRILPRSSSFLRGHATKSNLASHMYTNHVHATDIAVTTSPLSLTAQQRRSLDSVLRVDQAGEIAANWIYQGQLLVLEHDRLAGPLIQEMYSQEKKHLVVMDKLQLQHRVRPTVLSEVAKTVGFGLGVATALLGKEAAMACTEAVETIIGEHYDDQLKDMESLPQDHPSILLLQRIIREFRDDELEHLHTAVEHYSQRAPAHALLSSVVGTGCKLAIELCKRF